MPPLLVQLPPRLLYLLVGLLLTRRKQLDWLQAQLS